MTERVKPTPVEVVRKHSPAILVRASDAEREHIATMLSDAVGQGRLTLAEAEERLNLVYVGRFRHELHALITDLPDEVWEPHRAGQRRASRFPARLRIHAAIAVALSVVLIIRWLASDAPFFWPAGPMFLLFGSLLMHTRFVSALPGTRGGPPWIRERPR